MSILQIALTKRWLGYFAVTVIFAVICSLLGVWQWNRREQAVAAIERIENNYDATPVTLDEALPDRDAFRADDEWQPVAVSGEYLVDEQLLVRARPRSGQPGFEVIVPLRLDDGGLVVVNRGWLPVGSAQDSPDVVPAAPTGRVDVIGRIRPSEPTIAGRGAPEGQIATIHLPTIAERLGDDVVEGAYLQLADESPAPATRPQAAVRPEINEGPHLSYTFQWYVFALLGFIGFGWAIRQEVRVLRAADAGEPVPPPKRRRSGPTDDEEEDALLDAAAR
ncbi:SURF1 family protein [Microcella sp.]|uniref:SURF1 family cytochrome oxidase biogenesis protein n=1 Tax=Microcella sp. TaxID=1913979 RepID=UPI00391B327F